MGSGITLTAAMSGIEAWQVDVSEDQLKRARGYHEKTLARSVQKERITQEEADGTLARIRHVSALSEATAADWVVEAVTENLELKKSIFEAMKETFNENVVLATNTSSISITALGASVGEAADRVIGMHFFNPVPIMKLVEVIKGIATSEETTQRTIALAEAMGKRCS